MGVTSVPLPRRALATPLAAHGNHSGEHHAGEDHSGEDLRSINLAGANLAGTNFSQAYMHLTNFTNANLAGTNFTNALLSDSTFVGAILTPATTFSGAALDGADFSYQDLRGSDIGSAIDLGAVNFQHANLSGLTLLVEDRLTIPHAIVRDADLRYSRIYDARNADLTNADLRYVEIDESDIENANFTHANLQHSFIDDTWVQGVNFTHADLRYTRLDNIYGTANFSHADLRHALLFLERDSTRQLTREFTEMIFTGANLDGATFRLPIGSTLDLTGAVNIHGAIFLGKRSHHAPYTPLVIGTDITILGLTGAPHATPEPGTLVLLGSGLAGLLGYGWRRRQTVA
jgi:uncharacterized protein YjbI with pentapeptide repeats